MRVWLRNAVLGVGALACIAVARPRVTSTFDVSAETEWVEFLPGPQPRSDWFLQDAWLLVGDDTIAISGALSLGDSVSVVVERRALGPLWLKLTGGGSNEHIGEITQETGAPVPLRGFVEIQVPDLEERARRGAPVVLPVKGTLVAGRSVDIETAPSPARLRSGKVTTFGNSIFGWGSVFPAGNVDLAPGDEVAIVAQQSPAYGMIAADERPALSVGYRAIANRVEVRRPGGTQHTIGTTLYARLRADEVLQAWWIAFGVVIFLATRLSDWRRRPEPLDGEAG
jgi:hypothetical protein